MARPKKIKEPVQRTITRKVFFYRVNAGIEADTGQPRRLNFRPAIQHLSALPFNSAGRYLDTEDSKQLCCWPDTVQSPYRFRLANIRRAQHPPVENEGSLSPLVLGAGKGGLAEITHLILFPDDICGVEFNYYGPRASQLPFYFAMKLSGLCPSFRLAAIARPDLEERMNAMGDIKLFELKAKASFTSVLAEADRDLGAAFDATIRAFSGRPSDEFKLMFIRKKNKKFDARSVSGSFMQGLRNLARRPELAEEVSIFKVKGQGPNASFVDVLHEQFTTVKIIQPAVNDAGGVDSASMYAAIEEAYTEMQTQLSTASELS